uniref:Uncharacterized protein n=1 Tax=Schistosoma mansoni TaxID=6183 RepID=A0A5K4FAD2_SCHMA
MFLSIILCIGVFFLPIHSFLSIIDFEHEAKPIEVLLKENKDLLFMLEKNVRRRNAKLKKQKDLINEKFKNENKTIDQFIDCASKLNAGQSGLELIREYNINKSETWTSCIHEQQQIFQKMKDTYLAHICDGYITNINLDIDTLYNDIVHKEIRIRYYNFHLFKHQLLTDIIKEMKESR